MIEVLFVCQRLIIRRQTIFLQALLDVVFLKCVRDDSVFIHHICYHNDAILLCNSPSFAESLQLILFSVEVIHRPKYECQIKALILKSRKLCGVTLIGFHKAAFLLQDAKVVFYQLDRSNAVAFLCKRDAVRSGARADIEDADMFSDITICADIFII